MAFYTTNDGDVTPKYMKLRISSLLPNYMHPQVGFYAVKESFIKLFLKSVKYFLISYMELGICKEDIGLLITVKPI